MQTVANLLERAARSRRLAVDCTDYKLAETLNTLATELEAKAAAALAEAKERLRPAGATEGESL